MQGYQIYYHWIKDYWTSRGSKLDFAQHKYLEQIYKDQHPHIVYMKSAQAGITERMLSEAIWLPDQFRENSIYFFPTAGSVSDLVQERVDGPINDNQYLSQVSGRSKKILGKQADKVNLKRMSKGFVYFRGSNNPVQITSIPGDCIFVDEVDRIPQESIPYLEKRTEHSNRKWQRWGGTPTTPNFGIHAMYLESDQHECHIECTACKEWQVLSFEENIDKERELLVCRRCKKQIIPWFCEMKWIPRNPGVDIRGYHISQLYSPRLNVRKLIRSSEKVSEFEIQQFYNQSLGLPYEPEGTKITEGLINACIRDYVIPRREETLFMGIDVGRDLHVTMRSNEKLVFVGTRKNFFKKDGVDSVEELIDEYQPKIIVIDALPETRKAQELSNHFKGRVYLCYYSGVDNTDGKWFKFDEDKVNTDRTLSLDVLFGEIKKQKIEFPKNITSHNEFKDHLKSLTRVITKDKRGNERAEYIQVGADHYAHSLNYSNIAKNIFDSYVQPDIFLI